MSGVEQRVANINGPSVFGIGWIPYRSIFDALPGAYADHAKQSGPLSKLAMKLVFISGNDPPPDSFDGYEGLQEFIRRKDFRSIMGFHKVVYPEDVSGRPSPKSHELMAVPGYTAYRLPFRMGRFGRRLVRFSEGDEFQASSFSRDPTRIFLPLEKTIHFRIGRFGNRVSKLLTGHNAPFAFIECKYNLHNDGKFNVEFYGSLIPNYSFYIDWKLVGACSMLDISTRNLNDFLTADTKAKAGMPRRSTLYRFSGHVSDYDLESTLG